MILLSYDISNDKLRTKFSKFLEKYGHRIQYSVFEIINSSSTLDNIILLIRLKFEPLFSQSDAVYIFKLSETCKIYKFGYAKNEDSDFIVIWSMQTYSLNMNKESVCWFF